MADTSRVLRFRLPAAVSIPRDEKPIVRWAFSNDLRAWVAKANGKAVTAVALYRHGNSLRLDERSIYEALFSLKFRREAI